MDCDRIAEQGCFVVAGIDAETVVDTETVIGTEQGIDFVDTVAGMQTATVL